MDKSLDQLLSLQKQLEEVERHKHRLEGRMQELSDALKKEYDLNSLDEASKYITKKGKEVEKQENQLNKELEKLWDSEDWKSLMSIGR